MSEALRKAERERKLEKIRGKRKVRKKPKATTPIYISSQRYLDWDVVEEKREAADYAASYYDIVVDGQEYSVVVDGHHSLAAAKEDEVSPEWSLVEREISSEYDYVIAEFGIEAWLEEHFMDSAWYDVHTGVEVW